MCSVTESCPALSLFFVCLCSSKDPCWLWLLSAWSWRPAVLTGWVSRLTCSRRHRYRPGCNVQTDSIFGWRQLQRHAVLPLFCLSVCQINSSELIWSRELVAHSLSAWRATLPPNSIYVYQPLQQNPKLPCQAPGRPMCAYCYL